MHYLLIYEGDENWVTKRAHFRNAHLAAAWRASDRGEIILAGALKNPDDGGYQRRYPAVRRRLAGRRRRVCES
jgi:hypothetical protein